MLWDWGLGASGRLYKLKVHQVVLRAPAVHTVLMRSQRSPLLLSNLDLQHAAFAPVFLCPHEGKHIPTSLHISVTFSFTLLPPGWIKVADMETAKLKVEKHGGCDVWQPFFPFNNVPPSKSQNCPTAADLLHRCDIHSSFPVTTSKYFQQTGERLPGSLINHAASMSRLDISDFPAGVLDAHVFLPELSCDGTFSVKREMNYGP